MKKLQIFALLMLLSTGYIAQAYHNQDEQQEDRESGQGGRPGQGQRPPRGSQGQRDQQGDRGRGGQEGGQQDDRKKGGSGKEQVAAELGGSVTFESVQNYAELYAREVSKLSEASTSDEFKAVMEKGKTLKNALMQLAPKKGVKRKNALIQLPKSVSDSISSGPMRRPMPPVDSDVESGME
ncbi:MAG: hypothetical protein Q8Q60_04245 [Candidatus Chromulinivorax sp.]|nr:hypothetical protein [Candidatus Chromulinivorax sp.]